jgi:hypothetical protein
MNSLEIAAFIENDDVEYLRDVAAVALLVGAAIVLRTVERKKCSRRAHGGSSLGRRPNRDHGMKEAGIYWTGSTFRERRDANFYRCRVRATVPHASQHLGNDTVGRTGARFGFFRATAGCDGSTGGIHGSEDYSCAAHAVLRGGGRPARGSPWNV